MIIRISTKGLIQKFCILLLAVTAIIYPYKLRLTVHADTERTLSCEYIYSPDKQGWIRTMGNLNTAGGDNYRPLNIEDPDCPGLIRDISFYPGSYDLPLAPPGGFLPGPGGVMSGDCSGCNPNPAGVVATPDVYATFVDLATRWLGNPPVGQPRIDLYDEVVNGAYAVGMDPIFALSIWLHESGASNYEGICQVLGGGDPSSGYCQRILDFGINVESVATRIQAPGVFPGDVLEDHALDQLNWFLGLPAAYLTVGCTMPACPMDLFGHRFAQGGCPGVDTYSPGIRHIYEDYFGAGPFPCYPINI
jgi:hypothetical protein